MFKRSTLCLMLATSLLTACPEQPAEQIHKAHAPAMSELETRAQQKISQLEQLVASAESAGIDTQREHTSLWFAREFLKFARWDEQHPKAVAYIFGAYAPYRDQKNQLAQQLPDFERTKVLEILDQSINELSQVIDGKISRRPVPKVNWHNISLGNDQILSDGKPVFLYDYFSKSVGRPLTDKAVYNNHLGAIYHGGEHLYEVDHDRAINSFLLQKDGSFDDKQLAKLTNIPDTNVGFLLYWNMGIPEWLEQLEPQVRKGRSLFTGFDIDNPRVQNHWQTIARETGKLTRGKKVTELGYILSNEPHWFSEQGHWSQNFHEMNNISSYTLAHFQRWLKHNYKDNIQTLNANWQSQFNNFSAVEIAIPIDPANRGTPMWYDWCRFNMDRVTHWFSTLQTALREGNPDAHTSIKIMPNMFSEDNRSHGIDVEALTGLTSMIGNDAKTRQARRLNLTQAEAWEAHYSYFWEEMSMSYDFFESIAPQKIHFNSESHFLSASWWRNLDTPTDYVHSVYWLATLQGMDASLAWFWARDPDGSPEDRLEGEMNFFDPALAGSFAGSVNQQPHIANAYTQVMYNLNSFAPEIMALRKQRRPIRLFHSETSAINKSNHMSQQFGLYESLFFEGYPLGFATQNIIETQDNHQWDLVLVYRTEYVTEQELNALQQYLNNGGTVVVDGPQSLSKNQYGQPHKQSLTASKGQLILLDGKHSAAEIKDYVLSLPQLQKLPLQVQEVTHRGSKTCTWRVVQQPDGSYLLAILNLGKETADITLALAGNASPEVQDLLHGTETQARFKLKPMGVSLLKVSKN